MDSQLLNADQMAYEKLLMAAGIDNLLANAKPDLEQLALQLLGLPNPQTPSTSLAELFTAFAASGQNASTMASMAAAAAASIATLQNQTNAPLLMPITSAANPKQITSTTTNTRTSTTSVTSAVSSAASFPTTVAAKPARRRPQPLQLTQSNFTEKNLDIGQASPLDLSVKSASSTGSTSGQTFSLDLLLTQAQSSPACALDLRASPPAQTAQVSPQANLCKKKKMIASLLPQNTFVPTSSPSASTPINKKQEIALSSSLGSSVASSTSGGSSTPSSAAPSPAPECESRPLKRKLNDEEDEEKEEPKKRKTKNAAAAARKATINRIAAALPSDLHLSGAVLVNAERIFTCEQCGEAFAFADRLAKHCKSKHGAPRTSDSTCSSSGHASPGGSPGSPEGSKNFQCTVCSRSFARSDMLTRHSRLHSGLKPYTCEVCDQVFSRSDHLATHRRTHSGEKPYKCCICAYSACRRDMITRHMRTHLGRRAAAALLDMQL